MTEPPYGRVEKTSPMLAAGMVLGNSPPVRRSASTIDVLSSQRRKAEKAREFGPTSKFHREIGSGREALRKGDSAPSRSARNNGAKKTGGTPKRTARNCDFAKWVRGAGRWRPAGPLVLW